MGKRLPGLSHSPSTSVACRTPQTLDQTPKGFVREPPTFTWTRPSFVRARPSLSRTRRTFVRTPGSFVRTRPSLSRTPQTFASSTFPVGVTSSSAGFVVLTMAWCLMPSVRRLGAPKGQPQASPGQRPGSSQPGATPGIAWVAPLALVGHAWRRPIESIGCLGDWISMGHHPAGIHRERGGTHDLARGFGAAVAASLCGAASVSSRA